MKKIANEYEYVSELVHRIVRECPRRMPTGPDERKAQEIMVGEFEKMGLDVKTEEFEFNDSLYKNLVLHFGLGTAGTAVSGLLPLAGLAMHLAAGGSYYLESIRKGYYLRRLFPFNKSLNVIATMPAKNGKPDYRIVLLGHADAAYTGFIFNPKVIKGGAGGSLPEQLQFIERGLQLATRTQFILAGFDALRVVFGPLTWPLRPVEWFVTLPSIIATATNIEVVLRDEIVPGANDNLSAVASLPILASRLADIKPDNVELVFVSTGCEEASLGGADALAISKEGEWDKDKTVVIALDGLANGELRFVEREGEVKRRNVAPWISKIVSKVVAANPKFEQVKPFEIPVGGTDAAAFMCHGYDAAAFVCVDPEIGSPRHYHWRTDTPENLEVDQVLFSIDFAEKLVHEIISDRLGKPVKLAASEEAPKAIKKPTTIKKTAAKKAAAKKPAPKKAAAKKAAAKPAAKAKAKKA